MVHLETRNGHGAAAATQLWGEAYSILPSPINNVGLGIVG